jgi:hypothetical protein
MSVRKSVEFKWTTWGYIPEDRTLQAYLSFIQTARENVGVGRTVAQAVSRWLPTAAARVRIWAACRICGGQRGTWAGFLRILLFPLPIIIPPISPSS